jgi:hypothetical protein
MDRERTISHLITGSISGTLQPTGTVPRRSRADQAAGLRVILQDFAGFEPSLQAVASQLTGADPGRSAEARRALISAKSRARMGAARCRDAHRKAELQEMAEWILILLENPLAFPGWSALRKRSPGFAELRAERSGTPFRQINDAAGGL